ncbi:MAG: glycosyltransferase family 4 protein [bacterium]|nr:MAG: glycosyltransferase family 4 protein [bacterium]
MRILIINKYQNKVNRGAETYVLELSKRLMKNNSVEVDTNNYFYKILKNKYDVVIPTNGRAQVFIVRLLTWLTNAKMVVSGQSGIGLDDRLNLYAFPDYFVPLTNYALSWSDKINPFVKKKVIPNGVDLDKFFVKSVTPKKERTILAVGAFTREKRHNLTIQAVSRLNNTKLIIAGGGGDKKNEIQALGTRLLGDNFETVQTTNDKIPDIYRKADLFVFPTVSWESFGVVLVEAMASGLAVVATDDPIRREIVGDAGLFVDPTNTDEYAKEIEKALDINWDGKPRKQAEKFSWDIITKKYEELFNSF